MAEKKKAVVTYTHRDKTGMLWRFVRDRPVSALADAVMTEVGLPLYQEEKPRISQKRKARRR